MKWRLMLLLDAIHKSSDIRLKVLKTFATPHAVKLSNQGNPSSNKNHFDMNISIDFTC